MLCERCQTRPATVHVVKVVNGEKTEQHLCQECARETGALEMMSMPSFWGPSINWQKFLASMFDPEVLELPEFAEEELGETHCPTCGTTYSNFRSTGLFGCSDCYTTFRPYLGSALRRLQAGTRHVGRVPPSRLGPGQAVGAAPGGRGGAGVAQAPAQPGAAGAARPSGPAQRLEDLREQLKKAIAAEAYEQAALLRDQIHALEKELAQRGQAGHSGSAGPQRQAGQSGPGQSELPGQGGSRNR
ncbi:MAG: UvrB/UvrC motif-containing protein [Firmicutes bacterium]|nr:UvrB/UvrC motif-containing protein [Bacillota bacterium]